MHPHKLVKRVLIILLFILPIGWMLFTESGRLTTDVALLRLAGDPAIELNFDAFHAGLDEQRVRTGLPNVEFICEARTNSYGERVCHGPIAAFNETPARHISFFCSEGVLRAVKVRYRAGYHGRVLQQVQRDLGPPQVEAGNAEGPPLARWPAGGGMVVAIDGPLGDGQEPALLWLGGRGG